MSSVEEHLKALMLRGLDGDSHAQTILLSDLNPSLGGFSRLAWATMTEISKTWYRSV